MESSTQIFKDSASASASESVTIKFVKGFLDAVRQGGHDPKLVLIEAGIDATLITQPEARIDGIQLHCLLSSIMREMNDLYMGFTTQRYKPMLNSAVLKMATENKTLGEITRASTQYREAVRDDVHYDFDVDKKQHEFALAVGEFKLYKKLDAHLFYWLRLSTIYRYQSWLIGRRIKLNRVDFSMPKPSYGKDHLAMFHCDVHFDQPRNAIAYDSKYLSFPVIRSEAEIIQNVFEMQSYDDWLEIPGSDLSVSHQVEQVIENLQKQDVFHPTIDQVASQLRINTRSLRNQLARENDNFQQIKAKVRKQMAIKKLLSTALPVSTVAIELGFSEPGDFSRNFKRWTGYSPSEYRAQYGKK